uniref:TIL domain-containing protein n=1 Tax=Ascaris lumbricoides TaxID=6252 RepID=A0A0M3I782_ASCLU
MTRGLFGFLPCVAQCGAAPYETIESPGGCSHQCNNWCGYTCKCGFRVDDQAVLAVSSSGRPLFIATVLLKSFLFFSSDTKRLPPSNLPGAMKEPMQARRALLLWISAPSAPQTDNE